MSDPTFEWVAIDRIYPNRWNPNQMDPEMYAKAIESIHAFGFVDPVTVRTTVDGRVNATTFAESAKGEEAWLDLARYQLIDGEHRWKAAKDHGDCVKGPEPGVWERHGGLSRLPITNLGQVDDETAKQLTIVLNETRGTFDPKKMGALLIDLVAIKPLAELARVLPFDKDRIAEMAELPKVDWQDVRFTAKVGGPTADRWVERVYRLPIDTAELLDRAVDQVKTAEGANDWQAIQVIAESYLRE